MASYVLLDFYFSFYVLCTLDADFIPPQEGQTYGTLGIINLVVDIYLRCALYMCICYYLRWEEFTLYSQVQHDHDIAHELGKIQKPYTYCFV